MDAEERVTSWNPAAAELFGWSAQDAIGRLIDDLVLTEDLRGEGAMSPARPSSEVAPTGSLVASGRTGSWSTCR